MTALRCAAASDTGMLRDDNQDSGCAGPYLAAVADGVSGNVHGEVASAVVIDALTVLDRDIPAADGPTAMRAAIEQADRRLHDMAEADPSLYGMSTTLTALLHTDGAVYVAQVGDSRAYRLRDGEFTQMTTDHSLVQTLVDDGHITREEAAVHPQRSVIIRAINGRGEAEADIEAHEPCPGDRWLVCSDGLSDYVGVQAIHATLAGSDDLGDIVERLIELANEAGGPDNITCVVADVVDAGSAVTDQVLVGAVFDQPYAADDGDEPTARMTRPW